MEGPRSVLGASSDRLWFKEATSLACSSSSVQSHSSRSNEIPERLPWIDAFVIRKEFYVRIPDSFFREDFNLLGLESNLFPSSSYFKETLEYILLSTCSPGDLTSSDSEWGSSKEDLESDIQVAAEVLYELVHARFILTSHGMNLIKDKFLDVLYGRCPRICCHGTPTLPIGLSDCWRDLLAVKLYCPSCDDVFHPRRSRLRSLNGAAFGRSFPHNFFMHYPRPPMFKDSRIEPRLHGFKIHPLGISLQHVISKQWDFEVSERTSGAKRLKVGTDGSLCYSTTRNEADNESSDAPWLKERARNKKKKFRKHIGS